MRTRVAELFPTLCDFQATDGESEPRTFRAPRARYSQIVVHILTDEDRSSYATVIECFTTKYVLPSITLWRRASELWSRDQRTGESADAFYADMQCRVREVNAPADMTRYAMLKGLRPELRTI